MIAKQKQALKVRLRVLQEKLDNAKRRAVELAAKARAMAGPHGVILDAVTYEPLRAATKSEVSASAARGSGFDPVGPITIDDREVFAVPSPMLAD
jgi:hypothetical protein